MINAKERIILEHINYDGTINWNGVAGENDNVHDHWVDGVGDELITDFDRDEGDHILIEGHTTEAYNIEYIDSDGDNNVDSTIIHLWSNQANGGAHDEDRLGSITVANALLTGSDYTFNRENHGIVESITELDEAVNPQPSDPDDGIKPAVGPVDDGDAMPGVVLHAGGDLQFTGENDDYLEVAHNSNLELTNGTAAFSFVADKVSSWHALFSKDASGQEHGGHLTAFVVDGRIKVRLQQQGDGEQWLYTPEGSIEAGQQYHVAVTFGANGFRLYLDGQINDLEIEYTQGIETNLEPIAIGANIWGRSPEDPNYARNEFHGTIRDFTLYDSQFDGQQVAQLAASAESEPPISTGDDILVGTKGDDGNLDAGAAGVNRVFGDYGDDTLIANSNAGVLAAHTVPSGDLSELLDVGVYANILDGGHGSDTLIGSDHNDLLVSRADGREPKIAQEWDASDDPLNELDPISNTYYPGQPIEGDDTLTGGGGADLFYFQTLINAKERIILEHVRSDGTINWSGVAGENDNVHDHWVERLGDELITDFDRDEGDHILIEGHTTEAYNIEYIDSDGDNNVDSTVIHVWSNQANGGAHDEDNLGTITVANALLTGADYTFNRENHGIVETVAEIDEAITPYTSTPDDGVRPPIGPVDDGDALGNGVVLHVGDDLQFTGEHDDHVEITHTPQLALANGTFAMSFTADEVSGWQALFSKDASGQENGGHLTAYVADGRIKVRLQQQGDGERWLHTQSGTIQADQQYHVAVTFGDGNGVIGEEGFRLYLDGQLADLDLEYTQGIDTNPEPIAIGASISHREADTNNPFRVDSEFHGTISGFTVYDSQLTRQEIAQIANVPGDPPLAAPTVIDDVLVGTKGNDANLDAGAAGVNRVFGDYGNDTVIGNSNAGALSDQLVRGADISDVLGIGVYANILDGGHGNDTVIGSEHNDLLVSTADGREPKIAQPWDASDDPYNELDPVSNTHFAGQPV